MIGEPNGQHAVHAGQSKNNSNIRSIMAVMALMRNIFAPRKTSKNCGAKAGHGNMLLVATIKPWGLPWRCEECCIESTRAEGKLFVLTKWVHNRLA